MLEEGLGLGRICLISEDICIADKIFWAVAETYKLDFWIVMFKNYGFT